MEPSLLSLSASGVYLIVMLICLTAAAYAFNHRQHPAHARIWLAIAIVFLLLMVMRALALEEWLRAYLRESLRASGSYRARREVQAPIVALLLATAGLAGMVAAHRWTRHFRGRRDYMVMSGLASVFALFLLIIFRLISLHAVDSLLYGALKLNWIIDLGASLVAMVSAFRYIRLVRARP